MFSVGLSASVSGRSRGRHVAQAVSRGPAAPLFFSAHPFIRPRHCSHVAPHSPRSRSRRPLKVADIDEQHNNSDNNDHANIGNRPGRSCTGTFCQSPSVDPCTPRYVREDQTLRKLSRSDGSANSELATLRNIARPRAAHAGALIARSDPGGTRRTSQVRG